MTRERNALLDRVEAALGAESGAFERLVERRDRKLVRRRVGGASVGLGLTATILAALLVFPMRGEEQSDPIVPAESTVRLEARSGEYYYVHGWSWHPGGKGKSSGEVWVGVDDSGRFLLGKVDSQSYGKKDQRFDAGSFPADFVPHLSTDPEELLAQLTASNTSGQPLASSSPGRSPEDTMLLRSIQDLFDNSLDDRFVVLRPDQRAALFRAASSLDEVRVEPDVLDPFGRSSVRISWVVDYGIGAGSRVLWYFEPSTAQFMGELWVDQLTGEVDAASLVAHAGIARSIESVPAPELSYVPEATGRPDLGPIVLPPAP